MAYLKKRMGPYNLHLIKTDKFKTVTVDVLFANELVKKNISKTNFLSSILNYTSKKYSTRRSLAKCKQDLYSVKVSPSCYRMGTYYVLDFLTTMLHSSYTEDGMLDKTLDLIEELLLNPNVVDSAFDKKSFDVIYREQLSKVDTIEENLTKFSVIQMMRNIDKTGPLSYSEYGYEEDIKKIDEKNLYKFYKSIIKNSYIDIFVLGDIDFDSVLKSFENRFKFKNKRDLNVYGDYRFLKRNVPIQIVKEEKNIEQSRICIGCPVDEPITKYERECVLNIYNLILGGTYNSKLYSILREENHLCYNVTSFFNKLDNLIIVVAGINKMDFEFFLLNVKNEIEKMKRGEFDEDDIEKAKTFYKMMINSSTDDPSNYIASYYTSSFWNTYPVEERVKIIENVTREEIISVASKVDIDTVYLLGGKNGK